MAKSKKTELKSPPASTAGKKSAGPKSAASQSTGLPAIDTNLVAQVAAAAVSNKALLHESQADDPPSGDKKESSTFKHLKESLAKPGSATLNQFLHNTTHPAAKKSNLPFGGGKQVGHNQTFGADVTRSGVPRRTPG